MNFEEYRQFVVGRMSPRSMRDLQSKIDTFVYGLAGESGEVADLMKKAVFHTEAVEDFQFNDETKNKLKRELGDILFYLVFAADTIGASIEEVMATNVEKLTARYKSGKFTTEEFLAKEASGDK